MTKDYRTLSGTDRNWSCKQPTSPAVYRERLNKRFWENVDKTAGQGPEGTCWEWTGSTSRGYGQMGVMPRQLGLDVSFRPIRTHVIAFRFIYNHQLPEGHFVLHRCNNKRCVRDEHLFSGTQRTNVHHAQACGLMPTAAPKPERVQTWNVSPTRKQRRLLRKTRRARRMGFLWTCRVLELDVSHLSRLETGQWHGGRSIRLEKMVCLLQMLGLEVQPFLDEAELVYGYGERKVEAEFKRKYRRDAAQAPYWLRNLPTPHSPRVAALRGRMELHRPLLRQSHICKDLGILPHRIQRALREWKSDDALIGLLEHYMTALEARKQQIAA